MLVSAHDRNDWCVRDGDDYSDDHSMMRGLLALRDDDGNDDRHDS